MIALIGGEGLLNDATALTTFQIAVAATVGGGFSIAVAAGRFVLVSAGGLVVGAAVGYLLRLGRHLLRDISRWIGFRHIRSPCASTASGRDTCEAPKAHRDRRQDWVL